MGMVLFPPAILAQSVTPDSSFVQDLSLVGIVDASTLDDIGEDGVDGASQNITTTVLTSHDVYLNKAAYQLSSMRFLVRGYKNLYQDTYINGLPFNDQLRGVFNFSAIGALNILTRNGDQLNYTQPGSFGFGNIGGANNILMRAGDFRKGSQATLSYTNRTYYLRGMYAYSTGLSRKGWAMTALLGGRYSDEGNIQGTFYRNVAYALLLEKRFRGDNHRLTFTTFGSPVVRGQQSGSIQEVYDLTGNNLYNANWGYQNGKKRNSRVVRAIDPTAILAYDGKLSDKVTLKTGLSFHFGKYGNTSLNWFDGADPRPDYYRYLPSFYLANGNKATAEEYAALWRSGNPAFTQVNWDNMVNANYNNKRNGNGAAIYMVEERCSDLFETTFNTTISAQLSRIYTLTGGLTARNTISHQYKKVDDLLGADYVLDIDKYADTDYPGDADQSQKDLNRPNRRVFKGGIFDYDYKLNINSVMGWLNNLYNKGRWEGYYGVKLTYTDFFRDGKMRNGHHPNNSFGKGRHHTFIDMMLKGGLTYKFSGRHLLQANFVYGSMAPLANNAYISSRYSDQTPTNLESSRVFHADLSYIFSAGKLQGRFSLFNTNFYDLAERSTYYYDGVTLVNQVMTGVNKVHRGIELGMSYKHDQHLTIDLAGTLAQYYYANNPIGEFSADNGRSLTDYNVADQERVYMRNIMVGGVPQAAGTLGARYFIKYWFISANLNVFGRNFIDVSPSRRVSSRYNGNPDLGIPAVTPNNQYYEAYKHFTHQERFAAGCTLDLSISKIIYMGRKRSLNINLSLNNILNKKDVRTGGFEQGRIDLNRPTLYANKYFYMQGFNCFLNLSYKF